MPRMLTLAATLLLLASTAPAQEPSPPRQRQTPPDSGVGGPGGEAPPPPLPPGGEGPPFPPGGPPWGDGPPPWGDGPPPVPPWGDGPPPWGDGPPPWGEPRGEPRIRGEGEVKDLRTPALEALALTEEEAAAVVPLLDRLLAARAAEERASVDARTGLLRAVRSAAGAGATTELLTDYRAARVRGQGDVRRIGEELREVLTLRQEAGLVGLGLLD